MTDSERPHIFVLTLPDSKDSNITLQTVNRAGVTSSRLVFIWQIDTDYVSFMSRNIGRIMIELRRLHEEHFGS